MITNQNIDIVLSKNMFALYYIFFFSGTCHFRRLVVMLQHSLV